MATAIPRTPTGLIGGGVARAVMRVAFPALARRGLGANAAISYMKTLGYTARRQDALRIFNTYAALIKSEEALKKVKPHEIAPKSAIREAELSKNTKYRYIVDMELRYKVTGQITHQKISIYTDEQMDDRDLYWYIKGQMSAWTDCQWVPVHDILGVSRQAIEHNRLWDY
jgi:hypothetical protein